MKGFRVNVLQLHGFAGRGVNVLGHTTSSMADTVLILQPSSTLQSTNDLCETGFALHDFRNRGGLRHWRVFQVPLHEPTLQPYSCVGNDCCSP